MKKFLSLMLVMFLGLFGLCGETFASSWTIEDNYIGGGWEPTAAKYLQKDKDVVAVNSTASAVNKYDIDAMMITFDGDWLRVDILTDYMEDASDGFGIVNGDLFISSGGWNPYGTQPYSEDTALNGTFWDYAFDVSSGNLYYIGNAQDHIIMSDDFGATKGWNDSWYRHDQEVLVDATGLNAVSNGQAFNWTDNYGINYFSMAINISGLNLDPNNTGFHWAMTCANDVIEGGAPVPEPASIALLGLGMIALATLQRRFKR